MQHVVVTGASGGIGLELCRQYKERGCQVVGTCRNSNGALEALDIEVHSGVDVGSDSSVAEFARSLQDQKFDVLINCAGVLRRTTLDELDLDSVRQQFEINTIGPLRVTAALRSHLKPGARVAIVSSRMGSIADNDSGSHYGYRASKAAANAVGKSLAVDLKPEGVAVALLHPGFVRTAMTHGNGLVDANESAAGLIARMDELTLENSGSFWHMNGEILPW